MTTERYLSFRRLIKPQDLNPANRLFGGRMMEWADEAAALYAMCQMSTKQIVTLKISEILFKNPAVSGDVLEFYCTRLKTGVTSMHIGLSIERKSFSNTPNDLIATCSLVFVAVDPNGKPTPFGLEHIL